jgi:anti-sigma factor RsiW
MDCEEVKDKLPEYIDGELVFEEARRIRSHLTRCYYCNEELADLKDFLALSRHVLHHPCARGRFDRLYAAVHTPEPRDRGASLWQGGPSRVFLGRLAAAAAVIVFSLAASAFIHTAANISEPLNTRAVLNEKPDLGDAMTTVAWNAYLFQPGR